MRVLPLTSHLMIYFRTSWVICLVSIGSTSAFVSKQCEKMGEIQNWSHVHKEGSRKSHNEVGLIELGEGKTKKEVCIQVSARRIFQRVKQEVLVLLFQQEIWKLHNKEQVEIPPFRSSPTF